MTFGQRLLDLLYENDITQKQLAIELKIAPTTLNGYINNRREPDYTTLKQIAEYFHVTTDYLLGNENDMLIETSLPSMSNHEIKLIHHYRELNPDQKETIDELLKLMQKHNTSRSDT